MKTEWPKSDFLRYSNWNGKERRFQMSYDFLRFHLNILDFGRGNYAPNEILKKEKTIFQDFIFRTSTPPFCQNLFQPILSHLFFLFLI